MAGPADNNEELISKQVQLMQQLTSAISDVKRAISDMNRDLEGQSAPFRELNVTLVKVIKTLGDSRTNNFNKTIKEISDPAKGHLKNSAQGFKNMKPEIDKAAAALAGGGGGGFLKGLMSVSESSVAAAAATGGLTLVLEKLFYVVTEVVGGLLKLGYALLTLPFGTFDDSLEDATNQSRELLESFQEVRESFGVGGPTYKAVAEGGMALKGFPLGLRQVWKTAAEQVKEFNALMVGLGPAVKLAEEEFRGQEGALLGFQKGMHMSADEMKVFMQTAKGNGVTTSKALTDITKQAKLMGAAFGIDAKLLREDMARAFTNVRVYGIASEETLARNAVYARKLGVEIKNLESVSDAFGTFEEASQKVSTLNQAFRTNIDVMKLMRMREKGDTAGMLMYVTTEMQRAGVTVDKLTPSFQSLIDGLGITDTATLRLALSQKNQAGMMDVINKKAKEGKAQQMSQAEALQEVSKSIKLLVRQFDASEGIFFSLFKSFKKGFAEGAAQTNLMSKAGMTMQAALDKVYWAGRKLAVIFIEKFPGVSQIFDGLTKSINGTGNMIDRVVNRIDGFVNDLNSGKLDFRAFFEGLYQDIFGSSEGSLEISRGMQKYVKTVGKIILEGFASIVGYITKGIKLVTRVISGEKVDIMGELGLRDAAASAGKMAEGWSDVFAEMEEPLTHAFKSMWGGVEGDGGLLDSIGDLAATMAKKLVDSIIEELSDPVNMLHLKKAFSFIPGIGAPTEEEFAAAYKERETKRGIKASSGITQAELIKREIAKQEAELAPLLEQLKGAKERRDEALENTMEDASGLGVYIASNRAVSDFQATAAVDAAGARAKMLQDSLTELRKKLEGAQSGAAAVSSQAAATGGAMQAAGQVIDMDEWSASLYPFSAVPSPPSPEAGAPNFVGISPAEQAAIDKQRQARIEAWKPKTMEDAVKKISTASALKSTLEKSDLEGTFKFIREKLDATNFSIFSEGEEEGKMILLAKSAEELSQMAQKFDLLSNTIPSITSSFSTIKKGIDGAVNAIREILSPVKGGMSRLNILKVLSDNAQVGVQIAFAALLGLGDVVKSQFDDVKSSFSSIEELKFPDMANSIDSAAKFADQMVKVYQKLEEGHVKEVTSTLQSVISLKKQLEAMKGPGGAINLDIPDFTVKGPNITGEAKGVLESVAGDISINVNVKMDAEQVGNTIAKTRSVLVTPRVKRNASTAPAK